MIEGVFDVMKLKDIFKGFKVGLGFGGDEGWKWGEFFFGGLVGWSLSYVSGWIGYSEVGRWFRGVEMLDMCVGWYICKYWWFSWFNV